MPCPTLDTLDDGTVLLFCHSPQWKGRRLMRTPPCATCTFRQETGEPPATIALAKARFAEALGPKTQGPTGSDRADRPRRYCGRAPPRHGRHRLDPTRSRPDKGRRTHVSASDLPRGRQHRISEAGEGLGAAASAGGLRQGSNQQVEVPSTMARLPTQEHDRILQSSLRVHQFRQQVQLPSVARVCPPSCPHHLRSLPGEETVNPTINGHRIPSSLILAGSQTICGSEAVVFIHGDSVTRIAVGEVNRPNIPIVVQPLSTFGRVPSPSKCCPTTSQPVNFRRCFVPSSVNLFWITFRAATTTPTCTTAIMALVQAAGG